MVKNSIIFLLIFLSTSLFSQSLVLSELEKINLSQNADYRPRICLVDGDPIVLFSEISTENKIFVNRKKDGVWLGEQQINPDGIDFQVGGLMGPSIASRGQTVYVAYIVETIPRKIAIHKSIDGGINFSSTITAYDLNEDHALGIDMLLLPDGNPVIAFIYYDSTWQNANQVLIRSYDHGNSFTNLIFIDDHPCECCKPSLIQGDGSYYGVSFRDNESNIRVFKTRISPVSDADFSPIILTDPTGWESIACPASPSDGFLIGDTLLNVWMSSPDDISKVYFSKTQILGNNIFDWFEVDFSDSYGSQNHPRMDGNSQIQLVVWEEFRETKKDIFGKIIQNGQSQPSFSLTQGDSLSHMESVDVVFDSQSNVFHMVYRNKNQSSVMYRTIEPDFLNLNSPSKSDFFVYPNPSQNMLFISENYRQSYEYSIYNSLGILFKTGKMIDAVSIQNLPKGMYIIELFNSSQKTQLSFLKN